MKTIQNFLILQLCIVWSVFGSSSVGESSCGILLTNPPNSTRIFLKFGAWEDFSRYSFDFIQDIGQILEGSVIRLCAKKKYINNCWKFEAGSHKDKGLFPILKTSILSATCYKKHSLPQSCSDNDFPTNGGECGRLFLDHDCNTASLSYVSLGLTTSNITFENEVIRSIYIKPGCNAFVAYYDDNNFPQDPQRIVTGNINDALSIHKITSYRCECHPKVRKQHYTIEFLKHSTLKSVNGIKSSFRIQAKPTKFRNKQSNYPSNHYINV